MLNFKNDLQVLFSGNGGGGFSVHDDAVFSKYLQFCGIGLRNAQLYERSQLEVRRNQVLLDLAGVIFQASLTKLVHTYMHNMLTAQVSQTTGLHNITRQLDKKLPYPL